MVFGEIEAFGKLEVLGDFQGQTFAQRRLVGRLRDKGPVDRRRVRWQQMLGKLQG